MDRGLAGLVGDGVCTLVAFAIGTPPGECLIGGDGSHSGLPFVDPWPALFFVSTRCRSRDPDDSIRIGNHRVDSDEEFFYEGGPEFTRLRRAIRVRCFLC